MPRSKKRSHRARNRPSSVAGSKSGYVVDVMQNVDSTPLEAGDVVVITGNSEPVLGRLPAGC
jgi:hypothetical protein